MRFSPLLLVVPLALPLLAGCSHDTWDYLTSFGASEDAETTASAAPAAQTAVSAGTPATPPGAQTAQTAQAGAPSPFCLAVAKQDAMENGFDTATQGRVAVQSYRQCVATFGNTVGR
jgi:hypothetical protein